MATVIDSLMISIGVDPQKAREGFAQVSQAAQKTDSEFNNLAQKWKGVITGLVSSVIAPVAGAFAIGKVVNSYMSDVASVATLTGAYSEKLEEWRLKRAQLARVTREDIELYKKGREALTTFKIAFGDVSAKMMRSFMPAMKFGVDILNKFSSWINRNQDNIVRFFQVTAGVITAVFLPAIIKTSAAMLASPLTWVIAALGALVIVIDDLVTYMQGGKSALSGFWSYFGTGPEIMAKLNSAFHVFKEVISVIWKPLAALAAGFAAFKVGAVLVQGFISVLTGLKAALTLISAHPIMAMLVGLISLVMWVSDAFKRAGGDWSKVLDLMKGDLVGFLNLFGGLGDKLADFFKPFEAAFDAWINVMGNLLGAVMNVFKLVWAYISGAPAEAKDKIAAALWECIGGVIDSFKTYVTEVWSLIGGTVEALGSAIGSVFAAVPQALSKIFGFIGSALSGVTEFFSSAFSQLFGFISAQLGALGSAIAAPFVALGNGVKGLVGSIGNALSSVFNGVVSGVKGTVAVVSNTVSSIVGGIGSSVSKVAGAVSGAISSFASGVTSLVTSSLSAVKGFAVGIYQGIGKAVTALWKGAGDLAKATGHTISEVWQGFSRAFASVCDGLGSAWKSITSALGSAFDKVVSFVSGLWEDAQSVLLGISHNIGAAFEEVCNAISDWFGDAVNGIKDLVSSIPATVKSVFGQVVDAISNAFTEALDAASRFFDAVIAFFARIPQMIADAFDIGGMIDGATAKVKDSISGAWGKAKGFFGFGDELKKGEQTDLQPKNNAVNVLPQAPAVMPAPAPAPSKFEVIAQNYVQAVQQAPVAANTTSVVNNSSNVDNRRNSSAKTTNTNITINTNSDRPASIARAVQGALPDEDSGFVYASDNGNYNY